MALSPNDIRTCEFSTQMRGYQKEEVDDFLDQIAAVMEADKQVILKLSMETDSIKAQLAALKEHEDAIKNAAIDARRNADKTVADATAQAEEMLSDAQAESQRVLASQEDQLREIENRVMNAKEVQDSYLNKLRELIENHSAMLSQVEQAHHESPATQEAIEVIESSEVSRNGMETLATLPRTDADCAEEAMAEGAVVAASDEPDGCDIDPELTAALESYQSSVSQSADAVDETLPPTPAHQIKDELAAATDIPDGFVAEAEANDGESTGEMDVPNVRAAITDIPAPSTDDSQSVSSDELADELDKVVAKFEEEMDKAADTK
jgi:DivIVA domain-containing protein